VGSRPLLMAGPPIPARDLLTARPKLACFSPLSPSITIDGPARFSRERKHPSGGVFLTRASRTTGRRRRVRRLSGGARSPIPRAGDVDGEVGPPPAETRTARGVLAA
jgi:hypothetical protein